MHAITVKQPWAQAIAQFGKDVENRTRRPPTDLIGSRIAIHVGQATDAWCDAWRAWVTNGAQQAEHLKPLLMWATDPRRPGYRQAMRRTESGPRLMVPVPEAVPNAGRIVATARLIGAVSRGEDGRVVGIPPYTSPYLVCDSPWFTGPFGWVLADVIALPDPVGARCTWPEPGGTCPGPHTTIVGRIPITGCANCGGSGVLPIRGQVYPFQIDLDVRAEVWRQEALARGAA